MNKNFKVVCSTLLLATYAIHLSTCDVVRNDCPSGRCVEPPDCTIKGGKISEVKGQCNDTDGTICCDFSENIQDSCGTIKTGSRTTHFKSPGYPELYGGSLVCLFQLNLDKNTVGVKLDFIDLNLPSRYRKRVSRNWTTDPEIQCDSDWFFIKGFPDWMPDPRCGDLTGYSTMIEVDKKRYQRHVTISFIMSSDRYKWNIKLTQISSNRIRKMDYCLATRMDTWNKQIGQEFTRQERFVPENPTELPVLVYKLKKKKLKVQGINYPPSYWQLSIRILNSNITAISNSKNHTGFANYKGQHLCTGTIIDNRHILTSSSCFLSNGSHGSPRYPLWALKMFTLNGTVSYEIETLTFHSNFGSWPSKHDDIAVIRTKINILFDKDLRPINFPRKDWTTSGKRDPRTGEISTFIVPGCIRKTEEVDVLSVHNGTTCSKIRLKELEGVGLNVSELQSIGKYEGVLDKWHCLQYDGPIVELGCPLVQQDSKGENPSLIGIFSYSSSSKFPVKGRRKGSGLDLEDLNTAYFTKIQSYWEWILMSIS